jgi:hypothetical protein
MSLIDAYIIQEALASCANTLPGVDITGQQMAGLMALVLGLLALWHWSCLGACLASHFLVALTYDLGEPSLESVDWSWYHDLEVEAEKSIADQKVRNDLTCDFLLASKDAMAGEEMEKIEEVKANTLALIEEMQEMDDLEALSSYGISSEMLDQAKNWS